MKTVEYLDACKEKLGLTSDYQLSKALGLTRQALSRYRCEGATFNTATAKKVAKILGVHALRVRADAELERAKTPEDRALWRELAAKIGGALLFAGAGALLSTAGNVEASPRSAPAAVYYVKSRLGRWLRRLLAALALGATAAHAGPYLGIRVASSSQQPDTIGRVGSSYQVDDRAERPGLYAGYSVGPWALELGAGPLGFRSSHNVSGTFDIHQDIATRHVYGALVRSFGRGPLTCHALAGLSRVSMANHEYGWNENGPDQVQRNDSSTTAPIVGIGAAWRSGAAALRLDLVRINNVARSLWTGSSDVRALSVGLQILF